ncbi:MAG: anaerobic ribonucleoside-triphosphate reductase [Candidatus Jettenia sp.]|uniref:Anaerobic ribonucleoside-triphosphate reductase n=1 Tax=Candidatus Jettenia caeni TaxID=247490 RepID=I3IIX4_9BACT|nr:anaerobic ribonucleoside-triphosphate reductase [Candidatus Jettenia sp. AMX1]MBC6928364.1 anaerobic ribonucleoside-triphosphate reductase [Candidatus Jettenia sp.]WKZ16982.1 MAG: anaerobic ribonucleoside-triphosphate reductase [Candidatus Jettenia caeni]KAA0251084.1 MAG: anaerobic ribonucleoside-triphosphate reductase [Candidatus Jettenia sp. AMX1]MCE7880731.1 anaerobic ribonucleoside-triphosphate reductase [Candidatus Jettenia sp. AMX1]MCQ3926429.1 anaerobic ribonucleoside-triphosphate re
MNTTIENIVKRDGRLVPFNEKKIADAIFRAALAVGGEDRALADELAVVVTMFLEKKYAGQTPGIEDIQDIVEKVLIETGHAKTAKAYILYRDKRARVRESLRVRKQSKKRADTTDVSLMVNTETKDETFPWDKRKIADALLKEADMSEEASGEIASAVEQRVFSSGLNRISTSLIRELVDNELFERGYNKKLEKQVVIGMPKYDLDELIMSKNKENSNIATNNPEAINLAIAENTLKQFALQEVFSKDVADAHLNGMVHIHDLGYPTRVYCSSHSLEYLKKYGLTLQNLDTESAPAKHARTLTGHLNTFLASMQAYYAGALGVGYVNIMYAPYLEGMSYKEMKQEAQHLIFSCSQSAFSRGGQTLFLDFNIHTGVPRYLRNIPAIGPGGKPTGKTYGEYEETARQFTLAMLDVWREGDCYGHVFAFPKCDFHINEDTFNDPKQYEILEYTCQIASENGVPYFIFDRDEITLSACCRLRTTIDDNYMIQHPESMRFCGFQNITINLPQASYRAGKGNWDAMYKEIDKAIEIAVKAHLQKKKFVKKLMQSQEMPLWEIGKKAKDGRPYVDLEASTYIVGILGLNECLQFMTGRELHEGDDMIRQGLRVVSHMYARVKEAGKKHNLKFSLEESPAESASRRLAKVDVRNYPEAADMVKGSIERDEFYYTNSVHLRPDAPVDMITRIFLQSKFHTMIESGAIIHAFVGEERPPASSIMNLVKKTFKNTQAAQVTISPEFTICNDCKKVTQKLTDICVHCGSRNVYGISRIVGYFSRINNWNKSKIGELADRHKGNYQVNDLLPKEREVLTESCVTKC